MSSPKNKVGLLFPPLKLLLTFLLVTILVITGTAFSGGIVFNFYIQTSPIWEISMLTVAILAFCIVNFRITRGSFLCLILLKYYVLFLVFLGIPALIIEVDNIFTLITLVLMASTYCIISSKTYRQFVQYQHEFFQDVREAHEAMQRELLKNK